MKKTVHFVGTLSLISSFASVALANPAPTPAATTAPAAAATAAAATTLAPAATAVAETTVEGTIKKVVARKKEIYVSPADGGKKMEFYFPDNAQYLKAGQTVGFDALKEGQKVRVTYTKKGKKLNPTKAEILE